MATWDTDTERAANVQRCLPDQHNDRVINGYSANFICRHAGALVGKSTSVGR